MLTLLVETHDRPTGLFGILMSDIIACLRIEAETYVEVMRKYCI